jgi:hypothetical protein
VSFLKCSLRCWPNPPVVSSLNHMNAVHTFNHLTSVYAPIYDKVFQKLPNKTLIGV